VNQDVPHGPLVRWFGEFAEQGIFTTDARLVVTSWNRWLERQSGRPSPEVVGRALFDVYPDLTERGLDQHYVDALNGQSYLASHLLHGHLLPMPARVGFETFETMPQGARIAPLVDDGAVVGTITVIDDVSERVASEHELRKQIDAQRQARRAAEEALRVKDEFLATLSHEIRTPLNAVLGWARIVTERELEPQLLARALDSIVRAATAQARLIDDLLDTARMMAGKLRLQMQIVDLLPLTIAAVDVIGPAVEAKRLDVRKRFDPKLQRVLGDPDRLQQIIWNLLSNAVKFTEGGGTIDVRLEQVQGHARLSISDSGRGIDSDFLPFIFERFRQADAMGGRREGGLGLGLALVRDLVELHGGRVRAESPGPDKGATFVVEFPTIISPEGRQHRMAGGRGASGPDSLDGIHVLLVEEEADTRELLSTILSDRGAAVTAVSSSDEALASLSRDDRPPDVLVSDIGMAGEDAYRLIRELRTLPPERGGGVPVVTVTGQAGAEARTRALAAGYQEHVSKPVDPVALIGAINDAVRRAGP
jgi:signal transduction histidine kinase/CheY-like chemotaxis protein